ncbi:aspartyl protease family protein [Sphingomonas albertensis]|uniref:Aspartyl protease family protein n=1 Tax=Sphingomonas albertensis TaxID=2762591 RepID=A0ABR7AMR0_9SPHN|nr:aspartyl protease family protein [Sphingomonas albertensis]MBC3941749.1 aspartyl protease family protein [Sphingomonas albertensis]
MDRRDVIRMLAVAGGSIAIDTLGVARAIAAEPGRVLVSKIELVGSRVVMAVMIGDAGPYLFAIDTGGFLSLIDNELAKSLKLTPTGMTRASGVGGRTTVPVYLARDIVFGGGVRQNAVAFAGVDGFGFGSDVKGMLAAGILTTMDSDLDIEAGEWRTYPDGHPPRTGYYRIESAISDVASGSGPGAGSRHLYGSATVGGRGLRFLLDTGAPGGLSLDQPTARALGLWNDTQPYAPVRPRGIGGQAGIARIVRAAGFTFGGAQFDRPLVMLRGDGDMRPRINGIIGLQILRQFNLSTDVRARALWVKRHTTADASEERYGMSGLWIDRKGESMTVAAVGTGSPAAAAGVKIGDRIVGEPFPAVIRKISGAPGTPVTLSVERGGIASDRTFVLKPFL